MFDRPKSGDDAILVHIDFSSPDFSEDMSEFHQLALSAGANVLVEITGKREKPDAKYFVGSGKLNEIHQAVIATDAKLVIFNHDLSPAQERNVERVLHARVLSRTGLILDIFATRAHTFEGKLQVELAQLEHLVSRLVRGWTHLERQKGGIGLRGPGETQLEEDKRHIRKRIHTIKKRLQAVVNSREQMRAKRKRNRIPQVSLVGYTNAGKSSLFNALTGSEVVAQDKLFATLDPTIGAVDLPKVGKVIFADTVGFIRHLPHTLVNAFKATLEETRQADILIHVTDMHHPMHEAQELQVEKVLKEIDALHIPCLKVYNKIDLEEGVMPCLKRGAAGVPEYVWLSASTSAGVPLLLEAISDMLAENIVAGSLTIDPGAGKLRALLYEQGAVENENIKADEKLHLQLKISQLKLKKLMQQFKIEQTNWQQQE